MRLTEGETYWAVVYGRTDDEIEDCVRSVSTRRVGNDTIGELAPFLDDKFFDRGQRVTIVE